MTAATIASVALGGLAHAEGDGSAVMRSEVVSIPADTVKRWEHAECGETIGVPWFDGKELAATVTRTGAQHGLTVVSGEIEAKGIGRLLLTLGDGVVGAITVDSEVYRLRPRGENEYSLVQYDVNRLMPDTDDTNDGKAGRTPRQRNLSRRAKRMPLNKILALYEAGLAQDRVLTETGDRIDVLVAVTSEAAKWAGEQDDMHGILSEIVTFIGETNLMFAYNGLRTRLRLVGTHEVDYDVVQPELLEDDAFNLRAGQGTLGQLHTLRDQYGADIVSLLVLNGEECAGVPNRACGYGFTQRDMAGPGDVPGTPAYETTFASEGFNVVSIYAAFNGWTFAHEVGHNLGAHHDWYSFVRRGQTPTFDPFAHGWVALPVEARTVMSYADLCEDAGVGSCLVLAAFSSPLRTYLGERLGDPAPGFSPQLLGPADNAMAIERMSRTVANYRFPQL